MDTDEHRSGGVVKGEEITVEVTRVPSRNLHYNHGKSRCFDKTLGGARLRRALISLPARSQNSTEAHPTQFICGFAALGRSMSIRGYPSSLSFQLPHID
jgi:hypothetical protein